MGMNKKQIIGHRLFELRTQHGYSQFRLGQILGVTDKAISKWETGAAMPRTGVIAKLASIYGVSMDALIGNNTPQTEIPLDEGYLKAEKESWQTIWDHFEELYGEDAPLPLVSQLAEEEQAYSGTGLINHYRLLSELEDTGEIRNGIPTTLIGWLSGVNQINMMPPHTRCPRCHRTVFHPEVEDGWDLPAEKCTCGETLIRDGHNIPHHLMRVKTNHLSIAVRYADPKALQQRVEDLYGGYWKLCEYIDPDTKETWDLFGSEGRHAYMILPRQCELPGPVVNGVYQLSDQDTILVGKQILLRIETAAKFDDGSTFPARLFGVPSFHESLLLPETLRQAWGGRKMYRKEPPDRALADDPETDNEFLKELDIYEVYVPENDEERQKELAMYEDISPWLPTEPTFSDLARLLALNPALWWNGINKLLKSGQVSFSELPLTRESLHDKIREQTRRIGIWDNGIPDMVLAEVTAGTVSEHTIRILRACGAKEWLITLVKDILPKTKLSSKEDNVNLALH